MTLSRCSETALILCSVPILSSTPTEVLCKAAYHFKAPVLPQFLAAVRLTLTVSPQSDIWGLCLRVKPKS
jgi:hypothetical protein